MNRASKVFLSLYLNQGILNNRIQFLDYKNMTLWLQKILSNEFWERIWSSNLENRSIFFSEESQCFLNVGIAYTTRYNSKIWIWIWIVFNLVVRQLWKFLWQYICVSLKNNSVVHVGSSWKNYPALCVLFKAGNFTGIWQFRNIHARISMVNSCCGSEQNRSGIFFRILECFLNHLISLFIHFLWQKHPALYVNQSCCHHQKFAQDI